MAVFNNILAGASGQTGGAAGYEIERSLRFNSADSAYLNRTPSSAGNRKTWTWSGWVKRSAFGDQNLFTVPYDGSSYFIIRLQSDNTLRINNWASGLGDEILYISSAVFRDPSSWYHFVVSIDTTQATSTERIKAYVNGTQITTWSSSTTPAQNFDTQINAVRDHRIGTSFNGYLADVYFLDGLTPGTATDDSDGSVTGIPNAEYLTDFGEFDATTGVWNPIAYTGTYPGNSFYLDFSDNSSVSALGTDSSGNGNDWTVNNINAVIPSTSVIFPASNSPSTVELLVVGGGGGGGYVSGGGAGGFRTNASYSVSAGAAYNVKVGLGGGGGSLGGQGADGGSSYFDSFTAAGGGGGGYVGGTGNGRPGGSGGGGGTGSGGAGNTPVTSPSQGSNGGSGSTDGATYTNGGGGGGASATGGNANSTAAGNGGNGTASSITGVSVYYAGGGGGGNDTTGKTAGTGGLGGGGNGAKSGATAGTDGLGGGGGGEQYSPKSGGSGVVILRYPDTFDNLTVSSGLTYTLTTTGGYKIYSITASSALTNADIDSLFDSPTNGTQTDTGAGGEVSGNYATLNPLDNKGGTLSNGNLTAVGSGSITTHILSTLFMTTGKWYFECTFSSVTGLEWGTIGISVRSANNPGYDSDSYVYKNTGYKQNNNSATSYGSAWSSGDTIGAAFDADGGTLTFYINGSSQGTAFSGIPSGSYSPAIGENGGGAYSTMEVNFGQRPFTAGPNTGGGAPSGYKALCTANFDTPTIEDPSTVMDTLTWTGDGSSTRNLTGLGFNPDLVWLKSRSVNNDHNLFDSVRGVEKTLSSNLTSLEVNQPIHGWVSNFISGGFSVTGGSLGDVNYLSRTYVAWNWDAGTGSPVSNTDGTITSSVRANTSAGFSIVTFGAGAQGDTVGHGLGVAPDLIIVKQTDAGSHWPVYHSALGNNNAVYLNLTNAAVAGNYYWNSTDPTSSVFTIGPDGDVKDDNKVAYCWAAVEGYSAFGSYTGNGSTDGPFVYTGFRPAWILVKRTDSGSSTAGWTIFDNKRIGYNPDNNQLYPNQVDGDGTADMIDILSNGFKNRTNNSWHNASGGTYIYAAFAESPLRYARAR